MSVHVLITGTLFRTPEQKTSASGKAYVRATLKVQAGNNGEADFWSVLSFSETASAELLRLSDGDRVSLQGSMKLDVYTKGAEPKISRTVFADHVLALRSAPKPRKQKAAAPKPPATGATNIVPDCDLDDSIPF